MFTHRKALLQLWQKPLIQNKKFLNVNAALLCEIKEDKSSKEGGYAKALKRFEDNLRPKPEELQSFPAMLRNSKFIDLGDPAGKTIIGKIFHIADDDLYIDFGWKFHCVCPRPAKNRNDFVRGTKVKLIIRDLELSSKFLGYEKDLTLLEADCQLVSIVQEKPQMQSLDAASISSSSTTNTGTIANAA